MIPELLRTGLDASIRISVIAVVIASLLAAARVRVSSVRHAAWTAVLVAMLLMPVLPSLVPSIDVPVPRAAAAEPWLVADAIFAPPSDLSYRTVTPSTQAGPGSTPSDVARPAIAFGAASRSVRPAIVGVAIAVYGLVAFVLLARLVLGWWRSVRVMKESRPIQATRSLPDPLHDVCEASIVATPITIGIFRPCVVLPLEWRQWSSQTLGAVLAHEGAHIRRRDPLVSFLAHVNRCVFWFHPLAWWLERKLAATAEDACDDAGVRTIGQSGYAEVLLDIAQAVRRRGSRVSWQGVGVDGNGLLSQRVERILRGDLVRDISRTRKVVVAVTCAAAIVLAVACRRQVKTPAPLQPDPEVAQLFSQEKAQSDLYKTAWAMSPQQVTALQGAWVKNPEDLDLAKKLLVYYEPVHAGVWTPNAQSFISGRRAILLWLIAHHPDHELATLSHSLSALSTASLPDPVGYEQAKALWLAEVARPGVSAHALSSAAIFFSDADKPQAEKILLRALALYPAGGEWTVGRMSISGRWTRSLGNLYASALLGGGPVSGVKPVFNSAEAHGPFAQTVRMKLDTSTDALLLASVASLLLHQDAYIRDAKPDFDVAALGRSYLDRALKLDPTLVEAREALVMLHVRERWAGYRAIDQVSWKEKDGAAHREQQQHAVRGLTDAQRFAYLPDLADEAYRMGDSDDYYRHDTASAKAWWTLCRTYAQDVLALAPKFTSDPTSSSAVYRANIALGTLALRDGDRASAVRYMQQAAQVPASDELAYNPSSLEWNLVNFLLKYGERESVADFLERTAPLMGRGKDQRLKDAANIRAGRMPRSYQSMVAHQ